MFGIEAESYILKCVKIHVLETFYGRGVPEESTTAIAGKLYTSTPTPHATAAARLRRM